MIVVPDKVVDDARASGTGLRLMDGEAFVVDGFDEAFDFAVALGRMGTQPAMTNAEALTGLLKASSAVPVVRKAHREDQVVIRHHGFDRKRKDGDEVLEKGRRVARGPGPGDPDDGFACEIIDGRKFKFGPIFQAREIF